MQNCDPGAFLRLTWWLQSCLVAMLCFVVHLFMLVPARGDFKAWKQFRGFQHPQNWGPEGHQQTPHTNDASMPLILWQERNGISPTVLTRLSFGAITSILTLWWAGRAKERCSRLLHNKGRCSYTPFVGDVTVSVFAWNLYRLYHWVGCF